MFDDAKNQLFELHQAQNFALEVKGLQEHVLVLTGMEYQTYPEITVTTPLLL